MIQEKIERVEHQIKNLEDSLNAQGQTVTTTKEIMAEITEAYKSAIITAKKTQSPLSAEEEQVYFDDLVRCQNDLKRMMGGSIAMEKDLKRLKANLASLKKRYQK